MTKEQVKEFEEITRPVIKWLCENWHPHANITIDCSHAELSEGVCAYTCEDYIKD